MYTILIFRLVTTDDVSHVTSGDLPFEIPSPSPSGVYLLYDSHFEIKIQRTTQVLQVKQ